ncbi:MAG: hypothetical protein IRY99_00825 [Isosphaeraceae bacterium]|nr:hypothetical protein [Isosphaeraceae bacterium]
MGKERPERVEVLERGDIFFIYRPEVEETSPEGLGDVQRFYMALRPEGDKTIRLIAIGRKKLPEIKDGSRRYWGFVSKVARQPDELKEELAGKTYQTKTRGARHQPPARPAGEGVYAVVRHGDHTHLAYVLELPEEPGAVQEAFHIEPEASYILSIKNPEKPSPPQAGLPEGQEAKFPKKLMERFRERKFVAADPPEFLDYEGAEILLIGAEEDVSEELGIRLDAQREDEDSAEVFGDLRMKRSQQMIKPLIEGRWE